MPYTFFVVYLNVQPAERSCISQSNTSTSMLVYNVRVSRCPDILPHCPHPSYNIFLITNVVPCNWSGRARL